VSFPLRGELFWVRLDPTEGSEIGKTRPAAVVSNDIGNRHSHRVMIAPVSATTSRVYPYEVYVPGGSGGLERDGEILLDQIRSVDKRRLGARLGTLPPEYLARMDQALHIALDLRCGPARHGVRQP
jgi:mRNA interferase MazF